MKEWRQLRGQRTTAAHSRLLLPAGVSPSSGTLTVMLLLLLLLFFDPDRNRVDSGRVRVLGTNKKFKT